MRNILIVSSTEKARIFFEDFLTSCKYGAVTAVSSADEARGMLGQKDFALCVINAPLTDGSETELALESVKRDICQCLLVVAEEALRQTSAKMEPMGVFVMGKPLKRDALWFTLKNIAVVCNRIASMHEQNESLRRQIDDLQLVGRAKALLISNLKMSEPQAHKFLEKQAMERRITKGEVARRVIRTYEE